MIYGRGDKMSFDYRATHSADVFDSRVEFGGISLYEPAGDEKHIRRTVRRIEDMKGFFSDEEALENEDAKRTVYWVDSFNPVEDGTQGGLLFGVTNIQPGSIGTECFMTKGHFHAVRDRGEFYWGISGRGLLLLMTEDGSTRAERVRPSSLHYIPGHTAHRLVNCSHVTLSVGACWHADAGHEYGLIASHGFGLRVYAKESGVEVVPV